MFSSTMKLKNSVVVIFLNCSGPYIGEVLRVVVEECYRIKWVFKKLDQRRWDIVSNG